ECRCRGASRDFPSHQGAEARRVIPAMPSARKDAIPETGPIPLRHALREAVALGAKFRMSGAAVIIDGIATLPQRLREALQAHQHYLWDLIDNGTDREPVELLDNLGIEAVLVETVYEARQAVRQLIADLAKHGSPIGLDIETAPRPEYPQPRPCTKFNANGCISDAHPPKRPTKTQPAPIRTVPT